MSYNIASGDLASSYQKTVYGTTWNDSRVYQVCSVKVTAYGTEPLVFTLGTKFVEGSANNDIQYRMLARRITIQPGESYELDCIPTYYNQQVYVRQLSGNGIAYIYATPYVPKTNAPVRFIGTTSYQTGAGGQAIYYMQTAQGHYCIMDIFVGAISGSPTVNIITGATSPSNLQNPDYIIRGGKVLDSEPYIYRKAMMKPSTYMVVQVFNGVVDVTMLGLGVSNT